MLLFLLLFPCIILGTQFDYLPLDVMSKIEHYNLTIDRMRDMSADEIGSNVRHFKIGEKVDTTRIIVLIKSSRSLGCISTW